MANYRDLEFSYACIGDRTSPIGKWSSCARELMLDWPVYEASGAHLRLGQKSLEDQFKISSSKIEQESLLISR